MSNKEIKKNGFYAYIKNLQDGLALIVLKNDDLIEGVKLHVGKSERFSFTKEKFDSLLDFQIIEFVEILPRDVIKELQKVFKEV